MLLSIGILIVMGPVLVPVAAQLGIAPLHFGMVLVIAIGIGLFALPLGLGLYGVRMLVACRSAMVLSLAVARPDARR